MTVTSPLPWHILRQWRFVSCATKTAPQTCAWEDKEWQSRRKNLMTCLAWWMYVDVTHYNFRWFLNGTIRNETKAHWPWPVFIVSQLLGTFQVSCCGWQQGVFKGPKLRPNRGWLPWISPNILTKQVNLSRNSWQNTMFFHPRTAFFPHNFSMGGLSQARTHALAGTHGKAEATWEVDLGSCGTWKHHLWACE